MRLSLKNLSFVFTIALVLTACAAPPMGVAYDLPAKNKFQSCPYQDMVGENVDKIKEKLDADDKTYRMLEPDSPMTMDFSPDRINVVYDPDTRKIQRVFCG